MMKVLKIIFGVLTIIVGAFAVFTPLRTFLSVGWIIGAVFLVDGIGMLADGLSKKKKSICNIILGILLSIGGVVLLVSATQRAWMDFIIAYMLGTCLLCNGVMQIVSAFTENKAKKGKAVVIVCGILSILVGIYSVLHPLLTMMSIGILIAMTLIMQGTSMVAATLALSDPDDNFAQ